MPANLRFLEDWHAISDDLEPSTSRGNQPHLLARKCL